MRAKDQQLLKAQGSLREAQEDLARDEVIFAGKVKELQEFREANEQLQVCPGTIQIKLRHDDDDDELHQLSSLCTAPLPLPPLSLAPSLLTLGQLVIVWMPEVSKL